MRSRWDKICLSHLPLVDVVCSLALIIGYRKDDVQHFLLFILSGIGD
jgi:hypothetical protein